MSLWKASTLSIDPRVLALAPAEAQSTLQTPAALVVFAATLFNLLLCFVNTNLFGLGANVVIGAEIALIGMALSMVWYRDFALYTILLTVVVYLFAVMLFRSDFDPKIARDILIAIIFFFLGSYLGSFRSADRLVTLLIFVALGVALFEWFALDTFVRYFDVIHYYLARGTLQTLENNSAAGMIIQGSDSGGLFINGTRFEERTLLPFLGTHRASGLFMEPVSAGNFAAIAFAWVLLRDRSRVWIFAAKTLAIATILVLADARFGSYLCLFTIVIYLLAPIIRPTMLFLAPFAAIFAILIYTGAHRNEISDNTLPGRLLSTGHSLGNLDAWQIWGLLANNLSASGSEGDSGYGYTLIKFGLGGSAAIWALFAYAPVLDEDAWRFKNFVAFYITLLLTISASLFSIKTAALLWFLCGTVNNPWRTAPFDPSTIGDNESMEEATT
jgi:putative polymerase